MVKIKIKVNHQKTFSPSGCVYQRGFRINRKLYVQFRRYMDEEIGELGYSDSFNLRMPLEVCEYENSLYFMNLTQTELFVDWVLLNKDDLEINEKRARLRANGYMEVVD